MQEYMLDEILPKYRAKALGLPSWAYDAAEKMATHELNGGSGTFCRTPSGLSATGHEAKAATLAAIMSSVLANKPDSATKERSD